MSSLIFTIRKDCIYVATDTLAVSYDEHPVLFTTKAFVVPHLKMIIAGTGIGGLPGQWFITVNNKMAVKGIDNLDYHTPVNIAGLYHSWIKDTSVGEINRLYLSATIYHFGLSEISGDMVGYAYRSENGFKSEQLVYGTGIKPPCKLPEGFQFKDDVKRLMEEQRRVQAAFTAGSRVCIGGEIIVIHQTKKGFEVFTAGKFDDYTDTIKSIFRVVR